MMPSFQACTSFHDAWPCCVHSFSQPVYSKRCSCHNKSLLWISDWLLKAKAELKRWCYRQSRTCCFDSLHIMLHASPPLLTFVQFSRVFFPIKHLQILVTTANTPQLGMHRNFCRKRSKWHQMSSQSKIFTEKS